MDSVAVLGHASPLPPIAAKDIVRVAKRLARSGAFLATRYDEASGELVFMKAPERIPVAGRSRSPSGPGRGQWTQSPLEAARQPVYRRRKGERCWVGSIPVARGGRWLGRIEYPPDGDAAALLTLERRGKGARLLPRDAALVVPEGEAEAVLALLEGLFAQARGNPA